jgi:hypothetical protein
LTAHTSQHHMPPTFLIFLRTAICKHSHHRVLPNPQSPSSFTTVAINQPQSNTNHHDNSHSFSKPIHLSSPAIDKTTNSNPQPFKPPCQTC